MVVLSLGLFHYRLKYFEGLSRCGAVFDRLVAVNIGTRGNAGIVKPQRVCGTGGSLQLVEVSLGVLLVRGRGGTAPAYAEGPRAVKSPGDPEFNRRVGGL